MVRHSTALLLMLFGSLAQAAPAPKADSDNDIRVEIAILRVGSPTGAQAALPVI